MKALAVAAALSVLAGGADAAIQDRSARLAGVRVDYKVALPVGYDAAKAYPLILVFGGGDQTIQGAQSTVEQDWRAEAEKRGYIVVSPAAPGGDLYLAKGDRVIPAFLQLIRRDYRITGRIHIAGHSNGGVSAFHLAALYPDQFSTVTGYPGLWEDDPEADFPATLKSLCIYMHVGDRDDRWVRFMQAQAKDMASQGYTVRFTIEPNQDHRLRAAELGLQKRMFDEIESCR